MARQSQRHSMAGPSALGRRPTNSIRLRCDAFEDRITPTLFTALPALTFPLGTMNNNGCVAVADFNKDGKADAVLTNYGTGADVGDGMTIVELVSRPTPGYNRLQLPTGGTNVSFASVADINGDTWPDLVVSNGNQQGTGSVSVFRNDALTGALSLVQTSPFPTAGNNAAWVGMADVTGDGILDVVVANFGRKTGPDSMTGNKITIFQGLSDGMGHGNFNFSATPITTLSPTTSGVSAFVPTALGLGDFDGDNIVDIAAVSQGVPPDFGEPYPEGILYLFHGTGAGGFATPSTIDTGGVLPVNIQVADLNTSDTRKDLIVTNAGDPGDPLNPDYLWTNNSVTTFLNTSSPGSMTFGFPNIITSNLRGPFATAIADFDRDGKPDIAAVNYGAPINGPVNAFVSVYMGNGLGSFLDGNPGRYDTMVGVPGGQYLAAGDIDGNGTPDLFVAHDNLSNKLGILMNNTAAAQAPRINATQVNDGSAQRSRVTSLTVTFNAQVTFATTATAAFTLTRVSDGASVSFTATAQVVGGVTVVTLNNFSGTATQFGSLADGRYTLTALANQITAGGVQLDGNGDGTPGDNYVFGDQQGLFRFFGDINGDRHVDIADFGLFSSTFNLSTGQTGFNAAFDFNNDGHIDIADFGQFSIRLFTVLP
jgi:FG-GAP-like repeat/Dockerin type I domain